MYPYGDIEEGETTKLSFINLYMYVCISLLSSCVCVPFRDPVYDLVLPRANLFTNKLMSVCPSG